MKNLLFKLFIFILVVLALPQTETYSEESRVDWSRDVRIKYPRENVYQLAPAQFKKVVMQGKRHAFIYPVSVSKLLIPYYPLKNFFESDPQDPVRKLLYDLAKVVSPYKSMEEVFSWLGVHDFPTTIQTQTPNAFPPLSMQERSLPMGATLFQTEDATGLTFGCAACHSGDLFGVKVLGLTNRFPRANEFFRKGAGLAPYVNSFLFKKFLGTTEGERVMLEKAKESLKFVGTKAPVAVGLDTSLAQVALSLAKREQDLYATRTAMSHRFPRSSKLETMIADSKPAVWWNVKYKNRWLSDGSIVSGNPIHTNFLWNEIGRGTDLKELEKWLKTNQKTIEELTAAVFASSPPRFENFFGLDAIDIDKARRGQSHYVRSCQRCHGIYEKGWDRPDAESLTKAELLQNSAVWYLEKTPVKDVGTDPGRYLGMNAFAQELNGLAISKAIGTVVEPQVGYVPPPLDGIWSRWPYMHNNSIPNLCAVLTPSALRPITYWAGPAIDKQRDFDQECVGYPLGDRIPETWKENKEFQFDTRQEGLSNKGHDDRIIMKDGVEFYTRDEKLELIEFLKTL